jgi:hypothetical protein
MNLIDGILQQRDRLMAIKQAVGTGWGHPSLCFYRAIHEDLLRRADEAIGGRMEAVDCIELYREMRGFKE